MHGTNYVSDAEITRHINSAGTEIHDILVQKWGNDFPGLSSTTITTAADTDTYALPTDCYNLMGVDLVEGNNTYTLRRFEFGERNRYKNTVLLGYTSEVFLYRREGNNITLVPVPTGVHSIKVWYVPVWTNLVATTDTYDGVNGWDEYIVVDVATRLLAKEESDVSVMMSRKAALLERIEAAADNRDGAWPVRVLDTSDYDFDGGGFW
jgi:hypothetical protein